MPARLRDRQSQPWLQPGGRFIKMSSTALKWTGFLLTCLGSLGTAVIQRGFLKIDSYATADEMLSAVSDPASGLMGLASGAATCVMIFSMALPLYAKLLYEGWKRMEERKPFFLRLLLCALASEIPYDLVMSGKPFDIDLQNPAWGLLLCAAMLEVLRIPKPRSKIASALLHVVILIGALAWPLLLRIYMGTAMVILTALFYFLEDNRVLSTLGGAIFTMPQFPAPFGMLFAYWYEPDGEKDKRFPNLFYILYPAQLVVFGAAGLLLKQFA